MFDFIRKFKIQYRLIITFLIVGILPVSIFSIYSYKVYSASIHQKLLDANITSLILVNKNISISLNRYQYFMDHLYVHPFVQDTLLQYSDLSENEKEDFVVSIRNLTEKDMVYPLHLQNIMILTADGSICYDSGYEQISESDIKSAIEEIKNCSPQDYWSMIKNYQGNTNIIYGRKVNNINQTSQQTGYILLLINESLFTKEILTDQKQFNKSDILILDYKGRIMSSNNESFERGSLFDQQLLTDTLFPEMIQNFTFSSGGDNFVTTFQQNKETQGYSLTLIPDSYIQSELNHLLWNIFLMVIILIIFSLVVSSLIYQSIFDPIRHVVHSCQKIQSGNLELRIADHGQDELRFLSDNIDTMLTRLQLSLVEQQKNMEKARLAELRMLQYQINPHFLFNTLSTFRWIAIINHLPMLDSMSLALSEILRSTLLNQNSHMTLGEEVTNLDHYISIQKVRFMEKFNYTSHITPESATVSVPRFILQPIVENCIEHGTYKDGRIINITVSAYVTASHLTIEISDDGKGFDIEHYMVQEDIDSCHIGVNNIKKRLEFLYGDSAEFYLYSQPGQGTRCKIRIPV
ncbi:MAG: sensor histidine kinase [Lachnospiraceae bacterium]